MSPIARKPTNWNLNNKQGELLADLYASEIWTFLYTLYIFKAPFDQFKFWKARYIFVAWYNLIN